MDDKRWLPEEQQAELATTEKKNKIQIKNVLKKIKLPRFEDKKQQKAFGNIVRFFAVMILLTLLARGASGATLAVVKTGTMSSGEVVEKVSGNGAVSSTDSKMIKAPAGLNLEEMFVIPGQKVEKGTPIARFDPRQAVDLLNKEKAALGEMEAELNGLLTNPVHDGTPVTTAENNLAWAQQDVANIQAAGNAAIDGARNRLSAAEQARDAAKAARDGLPEDATPEQIAEADKNVQDTEAAVGPAKQEVEDAIRKADTDNQEAGRRVETAKQALESARISDKNSRTSAGVTAEKNQSQAESKQVEIAEQKQKIELLEKIDEKGILYSDFEGTVKETAKAGQKTDGTPVAQLSDASGGFEAEMMLDKKEAADLKPGMKAEVSTEGSSYYYRPTTEGTVTAISQPDETGKVKVTLQLSEGDWTEGQAVQVNVFKSRKQYDTCVPIGALRQNSSGYYVLVVDKTTGVLGEENKVRVVPVNLLAKDANNAAIETGALSNSDKIVLDSSKPLQDGSLVREGN